MSKFASIPDASTSAVLQALLSETREPNLPSLVQLPSTSTSGSTPGQIRLTQSLRLLPGHRWVVAGTRVGVQADAADAKVLLKLFVGPKAKRHFARELAGAQRLAASGVPTPALLDHGALADGAGSENRLGYCAFVLYDWIEAQTLTVAPSEADFLRVVTAVAAMHEQGVQQTDMHLGNFMVNAEQLLAVDVSSIEALPKGRRGRKAQLDNLAVLFAQRYVTATQTELVSWTQAYQQARSTAWARDDATLPQQLEKRTQAQRYLRVFRYLRKSVRDCTEFKVERSDKQRFVCVREHFDESFAAFARQPELVMNNAEVLKAGNTATVVRARLGGRSCIIKRYNIKNQQHQILQTMRGMSRAQRSWRNSLRLQFLGLPTAAPLALLESRRGALRSTAYLVLEDLGDLDLLKAVQTPEDAQRWAPQAASLLDTLRYCCLIHRDTKASNFIVHNNQLHVIDLDSLMETSYYYGRWREHPGYDKDEARFLRNWEGELQAPFVEALARLKNA